MSQALLRTVIFVAMTMLSVPASAQDLLVGSLRLSIGQQEAELMKLISARFSVVTVADKPGTYFLYPLQPSKRGVEGGIAFRDGKLVWAQKVWGSYSGASSASDSAKAVFAAIESATAASGKTASVSTTVQRVPDIEFKTVTLDFGRRKVVISSVDATPKEGGKQVSVTESVHSE